MDINRILRKFAQEELVLARNDTERANIKSSLNHLQTIIKNNLNVTEVTVFGSYTRNTILPRKYDPESDVDIMAVFTGDFTPETYRSQLSRLLNRAYPNSLSKKDFPAVKLELNHIKFDIVPAIEDSGFFSSGYYIPDKTNNWQRTEPNDLNGPLSEKNKSYGGNVIRQVIRLCKHWNATWGRPWDSYLMEKEIINLWFWGNEDTFSRFLKTMNSIAGDYSGVKQALDYINQYQGDYWNDPNPEKQLHWLRKLLPGL